MSTQAVPFRLIAMPCCGYQVCWVNPRLPTHCPECGTLVLRQLRHEPGHILVSVQGTLKLEDDGYEEA